VETQAQLETLAQLGCDHAQGYLFSSAVEPDRLHEAIEHVRGRDVFSPPTLKLA
jgi:EAL domain-containing protein (putative c-di-GMP-specific phosphodiesterase class I)